VVELLVVVLIISSTKLIPTLMVVLISVNSVISSDKMLVLVVMVLVLVVMVLVLPVSVPVVAQATKHHHSNHQPLVLVVVMMHHLLLAVVLLVVQAATNHQHTLALDTVLMLVSSLLELSVLVEQPMKQRHQPHKYNAMLRMLKVSLLIKIHKSFVVQLLVVYKPTHKTSKFASFNHHLFHLQAHSSSKKCAHLNHLHHHLFAFVNKLHLFLNHPHSSFVKNHQCHQLQLLPKQSSVVWLLYQFHHDQSSSNVFHLFHQNHVTSSSNVGFHMELKLNEN